MKNALFINDRNRGGNSSREFTLVTAFFSFWFKNHTQERRESIKITTDVIHNTIQHNIIIFMTYNITLFPRVCTPVIYRLKHLTTMILIPFKRKHDPIFIRFSGGSLLYSSPLVQPVKQYEVSGFSVPYLTTCNNC